MHFFGLTPWLSLPKVIAERARLQAWVAGHGILAAFAFLAAYVVVAALAIPGVAVFSIIGGLLFGRWLGTGLVLIGATGGAVIVFLVARSALGEPLRRRAGPLYRGLSAGMNHNAIEILLCLRLVPLLPFFLVSLAAALFDIGLTTFALTTAVGMTPLALIYTGVGREIGTVSSLGELLSPQALLTLSALAGLSLLPILFKRRMPAGAAAAAPKPEARP